MIVLTRYYTKFGTWGDLEVEGENFSTIERPWKGNENNVSCIPEGNYVLQLRSSPVVQRTSGFEEGWEITNVPGRTYIMFHVANWMSDVNGCVGVGEEKRIVDNRLFVSDSRDSFERFMEILDLRNEWEILIKPFIPQYP